MADIMFLSMPRLGNLRVTKRPEARKAPGRGRVVMPLLILGRFPATMPETISA
jgi:hypothetical protein